MSDESEVKTAECYGGPYDGKTVQRAGDSFTVFRQEQRKYKWVPVAVGDYVWENGLWVWKEIPF